MGTLLNTLFIISNYLWRTLTFVVFLGGVGGSGLLRVGEIICLFLFQI